MPSAGICARRFFQRNARPIFGCEPRCRRGTLGRHTQPVKIMDFTALHYQEKQLVIANVWDAPSAIAAQQAGFQALGTSSAAIANMLG